MKLCLHILLLLPITHSAQNRVSGKVVDSETREPLSFATVSIKGKPVGTFTNEEGFFEFHFSDGHNRDSVIISTLGYVPVIMPVVTIAGEPIVVSLKSKPLLLNEVVVNSKESDPNIILQKAFQKIPENYPVDPYWYTGFCRENG